MKKEEPQNPAPEKPTQGSSKPVKIRTPWASRIATIFGCTLFVAITWLLSTFLHPIIGAHVAMLYSLANNGRLSGRADGNVYMRNGAIRGFTVPKLIRNAYTTFVRFNFTFLSQTYSALPLTDRNAWLAFVYLHSDRFAHEIRVKGKNAFIGVNQNVVNVGDPHALYPIQTPIPFTGVNTVVFAQISSIAGVVLISYPFAAGLMGTNTSILCYATKNESPGISRPGKSAFRVIKAIQNADWVHVGATYQADISAAFTAKYGPLVVGRQIFVSLLPIANNTGQNATAQIFSTVNA